VFKESETEEEEAGDEGSGGRESGRSAWCKRRRMRVASHAQEWYVCVCVCLCVCVCVCVCVC
jgi:hypothetical protein